MIEFISQPWPWYVAGPLIGIVVPALFLIGGKQFGLSENLRHVCAMLPGKTEFFNYDWKNGAWNLTLILGIIIGGFIGSWNHAVRWSASIGHLLLGRPGILSRPDHDCPRRLSGGLRCALRRRMYFRSCHLRIVQSAIAFFDRRGRFLHRRPSGQSLHSSTHPIIYPL